ncbi:MAG: hypothetical protein HQK64_13785 [Desulfamplus sp.]|nr:hypothetical protein [Desulfamplus sp.]
MQNNYFKPYISTIYILTTYIIVSFFTANLTHVDIANADDISLNISSKTKRVAVFAFDVISKEDNSFIGRGMGKMLCSRIASGNMIKVKCLDRLPSDYALDMGDPSMISKIAGLAEFNGVDYILTGTVTIAGDSVSSDARLIELINPERVKFVNATGVGLGDVMKQASAISEKVKLAITGKSSGADNLTSNQFAANTDNINAAAPNNLSAGAVTLPTNSLKGDRLGKGIFLPFSADSNLLNQKLDMEIRGVATADIDGDGLLDLAVMDKQNISFFNLSNSKSDSNSNKITIIKKGTYTGKYYNSNIAIDSIDANSNGRSELFITAIGKNNHLKSYIIELNQRGFEPILEDVDWYFRALSTFNKSANYHSNIELIGQQSGHDETFAGKIYSLNLSGNRVIKNGEIATPNLNKNFNLFGFAQLSEATTNSPNSLSSQKIAWFDRSGFLNIGDTQGRKEWKSPQSFGSTALFIEEHKGGDNLKERLYINSRIIAADIDNDGVCEIITVNNSDVAKGYLSGFRKFNKGQIQIMKWSNGSMIDVWSGSSVAGYISDFNLIDINNDGYPELIYSAVGDSGFMNKSHSTIFVDKILTSQ